MGSGDEFAEVFLAEDDVAQEEAFVIEERRGDAGAFGGGDVEAGPVGGGVRGRVIRDPLSAFADSSDLRVFGWGTLGTVPDRQGRVRGPGADQGVRPPNGGGIVFVPGFVEEAVGAVGGGEEPHGATGGGAGGGEGVEEGVGDAGGFVVDQEVCGEATDGVGGGGQGDDFAGVGEAEGEGTLGAEAG